MSGDIGSTATQRVEDFQEILKDYIQKMGIVFPAPLVEDCERVLQLLPDDIKMLTAEDCLVNANLLFQYAMHIQKEENRNQAIYNWAYHMLNKGVAEDIKELTQTYVKYETKFHQCINGNSFLQTVDGFCRHAQARLDTLKDLVKDVRNQAMCFKDLAYMKRG